jgi:hypothetical protein
MSTRDRLGTRVGPMRLAWMVVVFKISRGYAVAGLDKRTVFCISNILACMDGKASIDSVSDTNCTNSHQFNF